jgi:hypothetical protein
MKILAGKTAISRMITPIALIDEINGMQTPMPTIISANPLNLLSNFGFEK